MATDTTLRPLTSADLMSKDQTSVAARLAAADARARLGLEPQAPGNVITKNAFRPLSSSLDALQAKINAQSRGIGAVVQASDPNAPAAFSPSPRRIAPSFDVAAPPSRAPGAITIAGGQFGPRTISTVASNQPGAITIAGGQSGDALQASLPSGEVPWWQRTGRSAGTIYGPTDFSGADSAMSRADARDSNAVIVGYNGRVIPKVVNANESQKSDLEKRLGY